MKFPDTVTKTGIGVVMLKKKKNQQMWMKIWRHPATTMNCYNSSTN
jgi:hypothetical protein